jgi:DNA-binding NarL/FixJ family response regulator
VANLKIVIADDHRLMLEAIKTALEQADDIEIVGETTSGSQVVPLVGQTDPDIVLLDFRMPDMDGLTCLDRLQQRYPRVKVVMLSAVDEPQLIEAALRRGASAFIVKHIDPRDLPSALRQASDGTIYRTLGTPQKDDAAVAKAAGLSESELRVLKAMAMGLSNKEIAKELWLSEQTVKFHLRNIYRKLDVANRTEASHYAYQQGLIGNPFFQPSETLAGSPA